MKTKLGIGILLFVALFGCNTNTEETGSDLKTINSSKIVKAVESKSPLENTKWERYVTEGCIDYYEFIGVDSIVIYYCEIEEKVFGEYSIIGDTITIKTLKGEFDDEFPEGSRHRHKSRTFYELFMNDSIGVSLDTKEKYYRVKND